MKDQLDQLNVTVAVCDDEGTIYAGVAQHWSFVDLDAGKLLRDRPILTAILTESKVIIVDAERAALLGTELAGGLPELITNNRDNVGRVLELIEACASSPTRHLRITPTAAVAPA